MRFYGLDPRALAEMPEYLYRALDENLDAVQAEELLMRIAVAKSARMKPSALREMERTLERAAKMPAEPQEPPQQIEDSPEKAREWLEARGVVFGKGDRRRKPVDGGPKTEDGGR